MKTFHFISTVIHYHTLLSLNAVTVIDLKTLKSNHSGFLKFFLKSSELHTCAYVNIFIRSMFIIFFTCIMLAIENITLSYDYLSLTNKDIHT